MLSAMDKRTQQEYIGWRAPELARSGHYRNWIEIVRMLRYEGAYIAHEALSPFMRQRLNRLCREATEASIMSDGPSYQDMAIAATTRLANDARRELELLQKGVITTHANGVDTTQEAKSKVEARIKDLEQIMKALSEAGRA